MVAAAQTRVFVRLRKDRLDGLIANLTRKTREAVDETATNIQFRAKQIAPKDTTSLSESIYINNGEESDYLQRTSTARSVNREVIILEQIDPEFAISLGDTHAQYTQVIGVAAGHGMFIEFGTRFMPPQPYMTPAVEPERDQFVERMKHIADV